MVETRNKGRGRAIAAPIEPSSGQSESEFASGSDSEYVPVVKAANKSDTKASLKKSQKNQKPVPCEYAGCPKTFGRRADMKRHLNTHSGTKSFHCPHANCDKSFWNASALKTHENVHTGEKPYKCQIHKCEKRFGDPSSRSRHEKEIHGKVYKYSCTVPGCNKSIRRGAAFKKHFLILHGRDLSKEELEEYAVWREEESLEEEAVELEFVPWTNTRSASSGATSGSSSETSEPNVLTVSSDSEGSILDTPAPPIRFFEGQYIAFMPSIVPVAYAAAYSFDYQSLCSAPGMDVPSSNPFLFDNGQLLKMGPLPQPWDATYTPPQSTLCPSLLQSPPSHYSGSLSPPQPGLHVHSSPFVQNQSSSPHLHTQTYSPYLYEHSNSHASEVKWSTDIPSIPDSDWAVNGTTLGLHDFSSFKF